MQHASSSFGPVVFWLVCTILGSCDAPPSAEPASPSAQAPGSASSTLTDSSASPPSATDRASKPLPGATISSIAGPGGVESNALPKGTFLGQGAQLSGGQDLNTPKGTLAELTLAAGRIWMNEQTGVLMPDDASGPVVLLAGELVVLPQRDDASIDLKIGSDELKAWGGEVQARAIGATRHYAVVRGRAEVKIGERVVNLGPGQSFDTPSPDSGAEPRLETSLRALDETRWALSFDAATELGDAIPRGVGTLTARRAGTTVEQQRLRLTDERITVNISGRVAHTEIEQAFFNDEPAVLEGIYRFPLPDDGSISGLSLLVGSTWMQGEILEKTRARQIFQSIVDATVPRDPALLEWERGNVFKLRIFPIPGRGERRVRIAYTQILPVVGGRLRYRYPLGGTAASGTPIEHFEFTVNVEDPDGSLPEAEIETPMLALERSRANGRVVLHTERQKFLPTFDLGVDLPVGPEAAKAEGATHVDRDGQAYFMLTLQPDFVVPPREGPVHYAFVLDRSHGTTPELWGAAQGIVDTFTRAMGPTDRFTVLACDAACDERAGGLAVADADALERTRQFLADQALVGSSDVAGMIGAGHRALATGTGPAERIVVYLGDGSPSSGELTPDGISRQLADELADERGGGTRVLALALGSRSDLTTLGAITRSTGGDLVRVDARDDVRSLVRELRLRAEVPTARNVSFEVPDGMEAVRQHVGSALRPHDKVVLAGKLTHAVRGEVRLRAEGPAGPIDLSFPVDLDPRSGTASVHRHLPRTWAAMEIEHLTQTRGAEAESEIVALSKTYSVLSRFTALLVLENDAMYREFNVVRTATKTDAWDGKMGDANTDGAKADPSAPKPKETTSSSVEGAAFPTTGSRAEKSAGAPSPPPPPAPAAEPAPANFRSPAGGPSFDPAAEVKRDRSTFFERADAKDESAQPPADSEEEPPALDDDAGAESEKRAEFDAGSGDRAARKREASPPRPAAKPATSSRPVPSSPGKIADGFSGGAIWESPPPRKRRMVAPTLQIRADAGSISERSELAILDLQRRLQTDPTKRSLHSKLVRMALRLGHPSALQFARSWAEVDPEHVPALEALADAMAAAGDAMALRGYDSVLDVSPFSKRHHGMLATAYASKGDLSRACSHHRALVSIDPSATNYRAGLVDCLARAGDAAAEQRVRAGFTGSIRELDRVTASVRTDETRLHGSAALKAKLTWLGDADLDLAIVDNRGRRLSTLRRLGLRAREGVGEEEITLSEVQDSVFVEVTRNAASEDGKDAPTVPATLTIRTPSGRRTMNLSVGQGRIRVARLVWSQPRW